MTDDELHEHSLKIGTEALLEHPQLLMEVAIGLPELVEECLTAMGWEVERPEEDE